ncbi:unnamed protein product [Rotaria sp. Silwood1]|nr:unnamed protein product [Rotaria sp. Silwood1]CAF3531082.1 unnamed protein product [Rotaria sp. Silwood1]CAF3532330.1 unnamed protein product [Rotaria sp. Silwood1]CAF3561790.1 unnamed protein product [Rotaria sp. Silwood1]CAF4585978.1 unnamed protein product [Rotaria sp. Silwood1]
MADIRRFLFPLILLIFQIIFTFLLGFHSEYKYYPVSNVTNFEEPPRGLVEFYYAMYTDIHVMMFIGFGFLMTFLRRYSFSAVGFNFILCAFTLEWAIIIRGYLFDWSTTDQKFIVDIQSLATADFVSASILISMGAVLGKVNAVQLILMAAIEVPIQVVNEWIGLHLFCAIDPGESMYVHVFGAYFGLAVSFVLFRSNILDNPLEKSRYTSDIFSMIGTIFLFCFWPSFNAGVTSGSDRLHAVTNTYVSICASVIGAFLMSSLLKKNKLDMVHVQNSTLAGGVAVGTVSGSDIGLHGAMVIGTLAGMISVLGFHFLLPRLQRIRFHDTCGVNNLHGMPGIMAGIAGIIVASIGTRSGYLNHLTDTCRSGGKSRDNSTQSAYQAAALGLTLALAIVGGLITGIILRIPIFAQTEKDFDDEENWHVPENEIKNDDAAREIVMARTAL